MNKKIQLVSLKSMRKQAQSSFVSDNPDLSATGIDIATQLGLTGLVKGYGMIPGLFSESKNLAKATAQKKIREKLEKIVAREKFDIRRHLPGRVEMLQPSQAAVDFSPFGRKRGIAYLSSKGHPGVHAHELGHILGPKFFVGNIPVLTQLGGIGAGLLSVFNTEDKEKAKRDAIISSALTGLTHLPREIDASARGFSLLSKLQRRDPSNIALRLPSRLKTFIGLPSYALATLAPYLSFKFRENAGVFDNKS